MRRGMGARVAITGVGAVTACGGDFSTSWERICAGGTGITQIDAWNCDSYQTRVAARSAWDSEERGMDSRRDRCHSLALRAAREALADAGVTLDGIDRSRAGISLGTSLGGVLSAQRFAEHRLQRGRTLAHMLLRYPFHVCVDVLVREFGLVGPRMLVSTACTASTLATAYAYEAIAQGRADLMLAGGVDPLSEFAFAGFSSMKNMATRPCAPFSDPVGLSVGEGAGMLVLERYEQAIARGARVYAEFAGYALGADAYHATSPDPTGQRQAGVLLSALASSGVEPHQVDYLNAHGTGTEENDRVEALALRLAFRERLRTVSVSSVKGAIGHTLGAAGAIEAALTVRAVADNTVPPTANFRGARPGCEMTHVAGSSVRKVIDVAVSQNFAFGGNDCALVFRKAGTPTRRPVQTSRDVVITGIGMITPIGIGCDAVARTMLTGLSGVHPAHLEAQETRSSCYAANLPVDLAGITTFDARRSDRFGLLTVAGAEAALVDARLKITRERADRTGIVVGTAFGPLASIKRFQDCLLKAGPRRLDPAVFPNTVLNAGAGHAARFLRARGPNIALSLGQMSGLSAIAYGADLVRSDRADVVIAGGVDELIDELVFGFDLAGLLARCDANSGPAAPPGPFEGGRGVVLGEASVFVALEARCSAEDRGAVVLASLLGCCSTSDEPANGGCDESGAALARCITLALAEGSVAPSSVQWVMSGAMGDPTTDLKELCALRTVFGEQPPPLCAIASRVGTSAATASFGIACMLLGKRQGWLPTGAGNPAAPRPTFPSNLAIGPAVRGEATFVLDTAVSFGGGNSAVVLRLEAGRH